MTTPTLTPLRKAIHAINARFVSGNSFPVEKAIVTRDEWLELCGCLEDVFKLNMLRAMVEAAPEAPEQAAQPASPTAGMPLGQRIEHVGGRVTEDLRVEFGSVMAVDALIRQVLRDWHAQPADVARLVESIDRRFRSSNGVLVERAVVPAAEWYPLCAALAAKGADHA